MARILLTENERAKLEYINFLDEHEKSTDIIKFDDPFVQNLIYCGLLSMVPTAKLTTVGKQYLLNDGNFDLFRLDGEK